MFLGSVNLRRMEKGSERKGDGDQKGGEGAKRVKREPRSKLRNRARQHWPTEL